MAEVFRKELTISLDDPQSIQNAIDAINKLSESIPKVMTSLCNYLAKKGQTIAQQELKALGAFDSGDLYNSIRFELADGTNGVAYVVAGYPFDHYSDNPKYTDISYAVFVEFGYGTANYYDTTGSLVDMQRRIDKRIENGEIPDSGRYQTHKSGNGRYRDAETYGKLKGADGRYFYGWKYFNRRTGKWSTSYGQNPKPFMYNTLQKLSKMAEQELGGRLALLMSGSM